MIKQIVGQCDVVEKKQFSAARLDACSELSATYRPSQIVANANINTTKHTVIVLPCIVPIYVEMKNVN